MLPDPVEDKTTVAPGIGLSKTSRAVTVIVEALDPLLAVIVVGEALTVECEAEAAAGLTVTVAV